MTGDAEDKHARLRLLGAAAIGVIIGLALFFIPLPVLVFGPGDAVDLNGLISVPGHSPPPGILFLTDVKVMPGRPAFYLAGKVLPGFEIVPRRDFAGNADDAQFDRELEDAMKESQKVAQIVAERAASLRQDRDDDQDPWRSRARCPQRNVPRPATRSSRSTAARLTGSRRSPPLPGASRSG